ncbi:helix-turn-helix transcriptional regulator [Roseibium sp.]|uniref:helix-turn-helix transcriptional regulator n=1 Tax=Roseibium sp. TaxID=1936156 RepID=UPI003B51C02A
MRYGGATDTAATNVSEQRIAMQPITNWKVIAPWALFSLQAICVSFIVTEEVAGALLGEQAIGILESNILEYLILAALVVGLIASGFEIRKNITRQKRMEQQVKVASGAFAKLLEEHFEIWKLTPSEADVALLALKGFSIAEIASYRETAEGTVKAQCNAIYRKAGVSGRPQLLSLFIDELLGGIVQPSPVH